MCYVDTFKRNNPAKFTCSKSTKETLEKVVKYVQSQQQRHQNDVVKVFHSTVKIKKLASVEFF